MNLQDPCFLYAEIHRLWELHQRYDGDVKAEKTKLTQVGKSLGETLFAMKMLYVRVGRNGRWSSLLREIRMNRATADRLVNRYAESKGLPVNRLSEAATFLPPDAEVSRLTAALWPKIEKALHSPLAYYWFVSALAEKSGLEMSSSPEGITILDPNCVTQRTVAPIPAPVTAAVPAIADEESVFG